MARSRRALAAIALPLIMGGWPADSVAGRHAADAPADPPQQHRLEINDLGMFVGNNAQFALNLRTYDGGLEYPRGSGRLVGYVGGLWVSGRSDGAMRMAIAEFGSEWGPGPLFQGQPVSNPMQNQVFRITRADPTGRTLWDAVAVPLGAPAGLLGEQTLWSVCNDLAPPAALPRSGRLTPAIGLETQITAYAFDRPGTLRRVAFLRLRVIHKGAAPLDSAAFGVFFDPVAPYRMRAACDTTRDMGYAYPPADPTDGDAVAVGVAWLGGPWIAGARLRPVSYVVYPNGSDPVVAEQFDRVLRGILPWGTAMIDSSTGQPTMFFSSGDPITGSGWVATRPPHPHTVLATQPFTLAPGDTQDVDLAIVIGRGADRAAAILDLRAAVDEARAAFAAGFANLPAFDPYLAPGSVLAYPNPAAAGVRIAFRVEPPMKRVEAIVHDTAGRRVRRLLDASTDAGHHVIEWDGTDDDGRHVDAGLYFVRVTIGGREHVARVVRLSGS